MNAHERERARKTPPEPSCQQDHLHPGHVEERVSRDFEPAGADPRVQLDEDRVGLFQGKACEDEEEPCQYRENRADIHEKRAAGIGDFSGNSCQLDQDDACGAYEDAGPPGGGGKLGEHERTDERSEDDLELVEHD